MSELASRTFNAERGLALAGETIGAYQKAFGDICNALGCEADDALALAAIAEQKGMIAALEADLERVQCELDEAEQALTAERQEECEITGTEQEIIDDANRLARVFYSMMGYKARVGYRFDEATHPQEQLCWRMSVIAYENLTGTDVENALAELDDSAPPSSAEAENE